MTTLRVITPMLTKVALFAAALIVMLICRPGSVITPAEAVATMPACSATVHLDCYVITATGDLFVM